MSIFGACGWSVWLERVVMSGGAKGKGREECGAEHSAVFDIC